MSSARLAVAALAVGCVLAGLPACGDGEPSRGRPPDPERPTMPDPGTPDLISDAEAVSLARAACEGKVEIPADVVPQVSREGHRVVVLFPTRLPPGTLGPDHHARVTLDATTGEVLELLGG